jgi:hypothetical protein
MILKRGRLFLVLGFMVFALSSALPGQITTGTLRGFISDSGGQPLPGVTIEITSEALMSPRTMVTDARGTYRFLYLPPGRYTVCAKLSGFETNWLKGIPVQIGQTATGDAILKEGTIENTIVVMAERPNIDLESSAKSYTITTELLATIPLGPRVSYVDVFYALPGVAGGWGNSPLVNAASVTHNLRPGWTYRFNHHNQDDSYENKIVIDGMEINDSMSGTSYYNFNYEAMEEIDVKTAGASAEYGNARSSFMNIVTKSGGNTLKGSAFVQFRPESFNWTNVTAGSPSMTSYIEPNITLSGPIAQDKLWFMASYKYNNEDYVYPDTIVLKKIVRETRGHMPYFKLTYQPTPKHTVSAIYQNDYSTINPAAFPDTAYSTMATAYRAQRGGPMVSLTWRWLISDSLFFNFVSGYQHKPRDNYSVTQDPRYTYTERFQAGSALLYDKGYGEDYYSVRDNILFSGNLTYLVDDLAGTGSHEFKTGIDIRPYQYANWTRKYLEDSLGFYQYSYGLDYANYGLTQPYVYRGYQRKAPAGANQSEYTNAANCISQNFYIQDNWLVSKNLSLQLGLRLEHQRNDQYWRDEMDPSLDVIYSGIRSNVILEGTGLAPRLGLTYNWDKIGVFKLHFGRYYEYVGTGDYFEESRFMATVQYRMPAAGIGLGPEAMTLYSDPAVPLNPDYNKDLKPEYNDEFVLSFERELLWNLVFETSFIYRLTYPSNSEEVNAVFKDGAFVDRRFPDFDAIQMKTWYGGDDRRWKFDYKGLQFNIKRNFSGRWGFMANYSKMWRNYYRLKFDTYDPVQFLYKDPSDMNWTNYGIRWAFHLSAFYRLPWDILVSTFVNGNSGIFIQDETGDYAWDASAPLVTISNGRRVSDIVWQAKNAYYVGKKWGDSGRYTDNVWNINARLSKGFTIGRFRLELTFDVYNVFNWSAYSSFSNVDIRRDYVDGSGKNQYRLKTNPQSPRAAQLTFKVEF